MKLFSFITPRSFAQLPVSFAIFNTRLAMRFITFFTFLLSLFVPTVTSASEPKSFIPDSRTRALHEHLLLAAQVRGVQTSSGQLPVGAELLFGYVHPPLPRWSELSFVVMARGEVATTVQFHREKNLVNLRVLLLAWMDGQAKVLSLGDRAQARADAPFNTAQRNAAKHVAAQLNALGSPYDLRSALMGLWQVWASPADGGQAWMAECVKDWGGPSQAFLSGHGVWDADTLRRAFFEPQSFELWHECLVPDVWMERRFPVDAHANHRSKVLLRQNATGELGVSVLNDDPSTYADGQHLSWSSNQLSLVQGAVQGRHLNPDLQLMGAATASNLQLSGLNYPNRPGVLGQMLTSDGAGKLVWSTVTSPSSFSGNYADLSGLPVLFSGNYADLSGKPTLPTWPAQVVSSDSAANITADWVNTAFPWSDAEVANVLNLSGATVSHSSVQGGNGTLLSMMLHGQGNLLGALWPSAVGTSGQVLQLSSNGQLQWASLLVPTGVPTLTSGQWVVGQGAGLAAANTITGDISVSSTGVTTIGNSAVGAAQVTDGSLTGADISSSFNPTNFSTGNLTVTSQANLAGGLWPTTAGNVGQLLQADANGHLIWASDNTAASLSANSVTASALADASVRATQLAASAVQSSHVLDGSLTGADLSSDMAFSGNLSVGGQLVVIGTANLSGILFPVTLGSANQMLYVDDQQQLQWVSTISANGITGGSITGSQLAANSVGSTQVLDATIAAADLAAGSIGSTQLASDNIGSTALAANSVGDSELQNDISLAAIAVSGSANLGFGAGNTLRVNGLLVGGSAGGNLWTAANLMPSESGLNLGGSIQPFVEISVLNATTTSTNLIGMGGNLNLDVTSDATPELSLSGYKLGLGTASPSANLHVAGNMIHTTGRLSRGLQTVTSSTNLGTSPMVLANTTSGNFTLTLPAASTVAGVTIHIKKINRDHGYIRVYSSDNIDGQSSVFLKNKAGVLPHIEVLSNGSTWLISSQSEGASSSQGGYMLVDVSGGPTASFYPVSYTNTTPDLTGTGNFTFKSNVIVLKWIPPGVFTMGNATAGFGSEHEVTLTDGFWAGVFELTQYQWLNVYGSYPSQDFSNSINTLPIHRVSYNTIRGSTGTYDWPSHKAVKGTSFMGLLQSKTGYSFDLPTEAMWEYACRAGTTTLFSYGNSPDPNYMWYDANSSSQPYEVGAKLPNPWGLYDMHGNMQEFCVDRYVSPYSDSSAVADPMGPLSGGSDRSRRGGAYQNPYTTTYSAARTSRGPNLTSAGTGFRLFLWSK